MLAIINASMLADANRIPDPVAVKRLSQEAADRLLAGEAEKAFELFLDALIQAGTADDLRAQCVIKLGDFVRRVDADAATASFILASASRLIMLNATRSRYLTARAMVYMTITETGICEPDEIAKAVKMLEDAIDIAQIAQSSQLAEGKAAESFAVHHLASVVVNYGTTKQRADLVTRLAEYIPRVETLPEIASLKYSRAVCLADSDRGQAIELMLEAAAMIDQLDQFTAGDYYAYAGGLLVLEGRTKEALHYLSQAERRLNAIKAHPDTARVFNLIEDLRKRLGG